MATSDNDQPTDGDAVPHRCRNTVALQDADDCLQGACRTVEECSQQKSREPNLVRVRGEVRGPNPLHNACPVFRFPMQDPNAGPPTKKKTPMRTKIKEPQHEPGECVLVYP